VSQTIETLGAFDPIGARSSAAGADGSGRYLLLDVFTDRPLEGNQLAVFTDARGIDAEQMQRLARELRISETVFVLPAQQGGEVAIRIFTPELELPFAGHPVLGTAIVVAGALELEAVTLETQTGPVSVRVRHEDGRAVSGWMAQPVPTWEHYEHEVEMLRALGVARASLPVEFYDNGPHHVLVACESPKVVSGLRPDLQALAALGELNVSCFAGTGRHWHTRMFAPGLGVPEDPATGSAAGPLALHLSRHGLIAFGDEIEISQGSEIARPSLLYAFAAGSAETVQSVEVGGSAVIVAGGEFLLG
jgi:trans-2,3-dihydro-3-hydroxyanthranilate isomerase